MTFLGSPIGIWLEAGTGRHLGLACSDCEGPQSLRILLYSGLGNAELRILFRLLPKPPGLRPHNFVTQPEGVVGPLLYRFELEGNNEVVGELHAVEGGRDAVASVDAGCQQDAHLIN
jgi:hypothetical protein